MRYLIIELTKNYKVYAYLAEATSNLMDFLNKITNLTIFSTKTVNADY